MQEARLRELSRVREQRNMCLESLRKVVENLNVFVPIGCTCQGEEISETEFHQQLKEMGGGAKKLPIAVIDDDTYENLIISWGQIKDGDLVISSLRFREGNLEGFVNGGDISQAINKRKTAKFVKYQIIPSFADDVANLIIENAAN